MAIINSTVMGKSRGKIGNVVTTTLKGQVIAKSRNYAPANPRTPLQVNSRNKMANAVMAWQFFSLFLTFATGWAKPLESVYNSFIRLSKNAMLDVVAVSRSLAAYMLIGFDGFIGNFIMISTVSYNLTGYDIEFSTGGLAFVENSYFRLFLFESLTGANVTLSKIITEAEWNAGLVNILSIDRNLASFACYASNSANKKTSNMLVQDL